MDSSSTQIEKWVTVKADMGLWETCPLFTWRTQCFTHKLSHSEFKLPKDHIRKCQHLITAAFRLGGGRAAFPGIPSERVWCAVWSKLSEPFKCTRFIPQLLSGFEALMFHLYLSQYGSSLLKYAGEKRASRRVQKEKTRDEQLLPGFKGCPSP